MLDARDRADVVDCLRSHLPGLRFAFVFGSAASGTISPDSDVDIAVDTGEEIDVDVLSTVAGRLESILDRPADLVDLQSAGPILAMQVLRKGESIVEDDAPALRDFEMYTPKRYEDWKIHSRPYRERLREFLDDDQ
ncbi:MAG: nucleotidyltransferase domain-containing protein [Bradymonadaceae bacterium]